MKKNFKYAIMSAIALVGAVSFSACSSSEDVAEDVNPTFDGEAVKTQFVLSVPGYGKPATRMTAEKTQQGTNATFLGITGLRFYPYSTTSTRNDGEFVVEASTAYGGATVIQSGDDDFTTYQNTNAQDKWYEDVLVPISTNAFLVYGKAKKGDNSDFSQGKTLASYDKSEEASDLVDIGNTSDGKLSFEQVKIYDGNAEAFSTAGATILNQMNSVVAASGKLTANASDETSWKTIGGYNDSEAATAGVTTLRDLFVKITATPYAGSARSVKAMLEDLQATLTTISTYNVDNTLAKDIYTKVGAAITAIGASTFPANLGLPEGVAKLSYNKTATEGKYFSFDTDESMIGNVNMGISKYVYPSELYYRANTPIRVANKEIEGLIDDENWEGVIALYQATEKTVNPTTRSIALVDPLQYAVGCLQTKVALANASTLKENTITSVSNNEYQDVDVSDGLKLTGVLVGSQDNVNWEFRHPEANGANVIFDNVIDVNKGDREDDPLTTETNEAVDYHLKSTSSTHMNYTLVNETKGVEGNISSENTEVVYVALEFENDFADFCGIEGKLIPKGTKFYLVGKLDLNANSDKTRKKVFEQDYTTIAEFTISSLKNAYNVVPDLRTPSLELGLSVDITWQQGIKFTVNIE